MTAEGDRVALLIIRAWVEAGSDPPAMRARLTATDDLANRATKPRISVAAEIDEICDQVRRWLTGLLVGAGGAEGRPREAEDR